MKGFLVRGFAAFLLALSFALPASAASDSVKERVEDATVNIYCQFKSGRTTYSSTGSGVFIGDKGVILTNAHVALPLLVEGQTGGSGECTVRAGSPARARYEAELLYLSPKWVKENVSSLKSRSPKGTGEGDFALLYVTDSIRGTLPSAFPTLPFDTALASVKESDDVTVSGYPAEVLDFKGVERRLKFQSADPQILSIRTFTDGSPDVLTISSSKISSSGISGGPVTTDSGTLIGIATAVESKKKITDRDLRAITTSYIDTLLLSETGSSLRSVLLTDYEELAADTLSDFSSSLKKSVSKAILKR